MTALKSLLFLIVAPGMVAGYIPLALLRTGPQTDTGILAYLVELLEFFQGRTRHARAERSSKGIGRGRFLSLCT